MKRISVLIFLGFFSTSIAFADSLLDERAETSPRFIVHLLDYLAKDYSGAVANGKIISPTEYQEQIDFSDSALKTNEKLLETKSAPEIQSKLQHLNQLIKQKAEATEVSRLAREIQAQVIELTHLEMAPTQWPDLKRGEVLYKQSCVTCHGVSGGGDGPAAAGLDPKPANFLDKEAMRSSSPFQAYNVIRIGVPGTGMAPFHSLSEDEVWALAFYIKSLQYGGPSDKGPSDETLVSDSMLKKIASISDDGLEKIFPRLNGEKEKQEMVAILRTYAGKNDRDGNNFISLAQGQLRKSLDLYAQGNGEDAHRAAVSAYLEGIEPIEPKLKANDSEMVISIETQMARLRELIEEKRPLNEIESEIGKAMVLLNQAKSILSKRDLSPSLVFTGAAGILLREGFEAVLIILSILTVLRAASASHAIKWVHGGWIAAIAFGIITWFFSGWIVTVSGAQREATEGLISIFAVIVLLYVGFWLHRNSEIKRWTAFLSEKIKNSLSGGKLWLLSLFAFIAVFREALETVLFLRALHFEGAGASNFPMFMGVITALILVTILSVLSLKMSTRIPVAKLFKVSSAIMVVLAVILTGKGVHALQEAGFIGITTSSLPVRVDLFGIYPTWETLLLQIAVVALIGMAFIFNTRGSLVPQEK